MSTKRLKGIEFRYADTGELDEPLCIYRTPHDFVTLTKRQARALRDFLNQQELGDKHICPINDVGCSSAVVVDYVECSTAKAFDKCRYGKLHGRAK